MPIIDFNKLIVHKPKIINKGYSIHEGIIKDLPNEVWKQTNEFPNYTFSNYGRIKNIKYNVLMSESRDSDGYVVIGLRNEKGRCTRRIHKIIATLFCPNPNNYTTVNHINHIRHDNRAENLEWCDFKQNVQMQEHKLSSLAKTIIYTDINGNIKEFESVVEAAEYFGITRAALRNRLKNPMVQRVKVDWLKGGNIRIKE